MDPELDSSKLKSILGHLFNLIQVDYKIASVEEAKLGFLYQNQNVRGRQGLKKCRSLILCTVANLLFDPRELSKSESDPFFTVSSLFT